MKRPIPDIDAVRNLITNTTFTFGITTYNQGDGILPTLRSLWEGLSKARLTSSPILLSESHDHADLSSAQPAYEWARSVGARLDTNSSDRRRSLKEALNVAFERAKSDVLILLVDDVLIPPQSLLAMIYRLHAEPRPIAVIGATLPDPAFAGLNRRAGAWQLRVVTRAAQRAPESIGPNSFRAEGAFWGVWRSFYSTYRFPVRSGSIHDDVELTRALIAGGHSCRNAADAFVYKVPPGSLADLCAGTVRSRRAHVQHKRLGSEYLAAAIEAARDPLGAVLYVIGRLWCLRHRRSLARDASEYWPVLTTTKRKNSR